MRNEKQFNLQLKISTEIKSLAIELQKMNDYLVRNFILEIIIRIIVVSLKLTIVP